MERYLISGGKLGTPDEDIVHLANIDAVARRYHCPPWEVEAHEQKWVSLALGLIQMEDRAESRRTV